MHLLASTSLELPRWQSMSMLSINDPYRNILEVPEDVLESLAGEMERRSSVAEIAGMQRKVLTQALQGLCGGSSGGAVVVDVGCGTGVVSRAIAAMSGVHKVIGVDPSPHFIKRARARAKEGGLAEFVEGTCTALPLPDGSADLLVLLDVLTHVPRTDHRSVMNEARRVLKDGGRILLKDRDLAGWSLTFGPTDSLSAPVETYLSAWSENRYLCRLFPSMLQQASFLPDKLEIYHVLDDAEDSYGFTQILLRSIKMHHTAGKCSAELRDAMVVEAGARLADKTFQCVLTYGACVGYKLAPRDQH